MPLAGTYPPAWTARTLLAELQSMDEPRDDLSSCLYIMERLARGTLAPWARGVENAALGVGDAMKRLDDAIRRAVEADDA